MPSRSVISSPLVHRLTPRRRFDAAPRKPPPSSSPSSQTQPQTQIGCDRTAPNKAMAANPTKEDDEQRNEDASSDDDDDSSSGDESSSDSDSDDGESPVSQHQKAQVSTTIDRAALAASLPPNTDIDGLSDYELLRLKNIQRNQAKLASLGLSGITSKESTKKDGAKTYRSEAARKAAETRRRNSQRAKIMIEDHERLERWDKGKAGDDSGGVAMAGTDPPLSTRSQPSRAAKSRDTSYTRLLYSTPPKRVQQWTARLSELKSFYSIHGHYKISSTIEDGRYKTLCGWFKRQQTQYMKHKRGEKSTLDEERISLLEGLKGDWFSSRMSGFATLRQGLRPRSSPAGKNIARQLWNSSESETEEDEAMIERVNREVDEESTEDEEVEIGSLDSYAKESLDDHHQYEMEKEEHGGKDLRRGNGGRKSKIRSSVDYYSDDLEVDGSRWQKQVDGHNISLSAKKNGATKGRRRRPVSSLEHTAPERQSHHTSSPQKRRRSHQNKSSLGKRKYSFSSNEDSAISSEREYKYMIERGESFHNSDHHERRRKHYHREHNHFHGRQRMSTVVTRPMKEIIIAPSPSQSTRAEYKYNEHRSIEVRRKNMEIGQQKLQRDELLAEYGRLYGRLCLINAQKAQLEYELQAHQSYIASARSIHHGVAGSMLPPTATAATIAAASTKLIDSSGGGLSKLPSIQYHS